MLYDYYTSNYHYLDIVSPNDTIVTLETKNSKEQTFEVKANKTVSKYLNKDITKDNFEFKYNGLEKLDYFTKEGQIGTVDVLLNNEIVDTLPVIYSGGLTFSIISFIVNNILIIIFISIGLILLIILIFKKLLIYMKNLVKN